MNKHLIVIGTAVLLLAVGLSGCEELEKLLDKPDYITVTVNCYASVNMWVITEGLTDCKPAKDVLIRVEIIKAGGERVSELVPTNANGKAEKVIGTFKLYREQPITCIANVVLASVEQYPNYTFNSISETITWNSIYPEYKFGDNVWEDVYLQIFGSENKN